MRPNAERQDARAIVRALSERDRSFELEPEPRVRIAHETDGRVRLRVEDGVAADAPRLAAYLRSTPGVLDAVAASASGSIVVRFDPDRVQVSGLLEIARTSRRSDWPDLAFPVERVWPRTGFDSAVLAATLSETLPAPIIVGAIAITALPSAHRAASAFVRGELTIDTLDLAAIVASLATSRFGTAALMTWLLTLGDAVLEKTSGRARRAVASLMQLEVPHAWRLTALGRTERVPAKKLARGDRIVVYTGESAPADGIVIEGAAMVDEKALTGESLPRGRREGDRVLAASVVIEGRLVLEVDRAGRDTAAARIMSIVEGAAAKPMTLQSNAERVANGLVLPTIALAIFAALATGDVDRLTSVLITDFGTGIRVAVPAAALAAITLAAHEGILVKGAHHLERMARADTIVFDKTGTLTRGDPALVDVRAVGKRPLYETLSYAAATEAHQHHPVAFAIRKWTAAHGIAAHRGPIADERARLGKGASAVIAGARVVVGRRQLLRDEGIDISAAELVRARHRAIGASSLLVAIDGKLEAVLGYADEARSESARVVERLRGRKKRELVLMSGDVRRTASALGRRLGVDRVVAELLPEDKARAIRAMQASGHIVAMVGDGINDAPALALSDVGISLRGSTELALETADVVLLESGLAKLPRTFELAGRAMRRVNDALVLVIAPNAIAIVLGALGLLPPAVAAAVNNGSTVLAGAYAVAPLLSASRSRKLRR